MVSNKVIEYKYNESNLIAGLQEYVDRTYDQHYSQNKFQATEFVIDAGHGEGFALGNVLKYVQRYGKKAGKNRDDLLKVLHYALIALYVHDTQEEYFPTKDVDWDQREKEKTTQVSTMHRSAQSNMELFYEIREPEDVIKPTEFTPLLNMVSPRVKIIKCSDPHLWYSDKIGHVFVPNGPILDPGTPNPVYRTRDNGGYTNFVSVGDCEPL